MRNINTKHKHKHQISLDKQTKEEEKSLMKIVAECIVYCVYILYKCKKWDTNTEKKCTKYHSYSFVEQFCLFVNQYQTA